MVMGMEERLQSPSDRADRQIGKLVPYLWKRIDPADDLPTAGNLSAVGICLEGTLRLASTTSVYFRHRAHFNVTMAARISPSLDT